MLRTNQSNSVLTLSPTIMSSISRIGLTDRTLSGSALLKQKKDQLALNCPEYPSWVNERLYLSWDFYPNPEKFETDSEINKLSLSLQEDMIIEDLLNCMAVSLN